MKLKMHGESTSVAEVSNIESVGFWLLLDGEELFLDYKKFPWFLDVPVKKIINVKSESDQHLYWPDLDVDLTVEMIKHPERFPLKAKRADQVAESAAGYASK
ncbi:MAG: DUF2442 domain-containing protein [Kiritimatiellae bacterium]|nr:DUF2442 domain-containing protein [Kiritimatiellia bacterium]